MLFVKNIKKSSFPCFNMSYMTQKWHLRTVTQVFVGLKDDIIWFFFTSINKNRLNRVMLPEKVLDTGKYKKLGKAELCFSALYFYSIYKVS
jgi:hypothetical protein